MSTKQPKPRDRPIKKPMWKKILLAFGPPAVLLPLSFLVEDLFPVGDWRWILILVCFLVLGLVAYRKEVLTWLPVRKSAPEPEVENETSTAPNNPDIKAWEMAPGAGLLAAAAIDQAESMDDARRIFRVFQAQPSRKNVHKAYDAYSNRLKRAGLGDSDEACQLGSDRALEEDRDE